MADQSTQSITIAARPEDVMAVVADFARYPEWADGVARCEVVDTHPDGKAKQVHFVLDAGMVKDDYVLEYDWADDGTRVDWHLVRGQMQRSQRGSYQLRGGGGGGDGGGDGASGTEVRYSLAVDLAVPMPGMLKRRAEKAIMDTALRKLKARVEG